MQTDITFNWLRQQAKRKYFRPNPVSGMGHLMLQFNADKPGLMQVKIADLKGQIILETQLTAVPGLNNGHLHLGGVPAGTYIIYFSLDGINESYRVNKE